MSGVWLLNPPTKKNKRRKRTARKARTMKRKRSKRTGRFLKGGGGSRKRSSRRRRRNAPAAPSPPSTPNTHRNANPRRRRARRAARATTRFFGVSIPSAQTLLAGVAGMAAVRTLPGIIGANFPMLPTVGPAGIAVRAAVALFGGRLVAAGAGTKAGKDFTLGGLLSVADELSRTYILPAVGLGAYVTPAYDGDPFGTYLPAVVGAAAVGDVGNDAISPGRSVAPSRLDPANRFSA